MSILLDRAHQGGLDSPPATSSKPEAPIPSQAVAASVVAQEELSASQRREASTQARAITITRDVVNLTDGLKNLGSQVDGIAGDTLLSIGQPEMART